MKYVVHIQSNETKEIRIFNPGWEWHDSSLFWWTDGNAGCDCNRSDFFGDRNDSCGHTRYTILKAVMADGSEIQIDGNEELY